MSEGSRGNFDFRRCVVVLVFKFGLDFHIEMTLECFSNVNHVFFFVPMTIFPRTSIFNFSVHFKVNFQFIHFTPLYISSFYVFYCNYDNT